jgi:uncharacterized membrane protein YcaP (DUF421 family)
MKSLWFRNLIQGKPIFIIKNGKLQQKELVRLRFTIDDLVDALRQQGAFDISQVENAIVETNGSLSVQLKTEYSPVTPSQVNIKSDKSTVPITIVMDGKPITEYFGSTKYEQSQINLITQSTGVAMQDILLLNYDDNGNAYLIRKDKKR